MSREVLDGPMTSNELIFGGQNNRFQVPILEYRKGHKRMGGGGNRNRQVPLFSFETGPMPTLSLDKPGSFPTLDDLRNLSPEDLGRLEESLIEMRLRVTLGAQVREIENLLRAIGEQKTFREWDTVLPEGGHTRTFGGPISGGDPLKE